MKKYVEELATPIKWKTVWDEHFSRHRGKKEITKQMIEDIVRAELRAQRPFWEKALGVDSRRGRARSRSRSSSPDRSLSPRPRSARPAAAAAPIPKPRPSAFPSYARPLPPSLMPVKSAAPQMMPVTPVKSTAPQMMPVTPVKARRAMEEEVVLAPETPHAMADDGDVELQRAIMLSMQETVPTEEMEDPISVPSSRAPSPVSDAPDEIEDFDEPAQVAKALTDSAKEYAQRRMPAKTCSICLAETGFPNLACMSRKCEHSCCASCLEKHVAASLEHKSTVRCVGDPTTGVLCDQLVDPQVIVTYCNEQVLAKCGYFGSDQMAAFIGTTPLAKPVKCPAPECRTLISMSIDHEHLRCPSSRCAILICAKCGEPEHGDRACTSDHAAEPLSKEYLDKYTKPCKCGRNLQHFRDHGCHTIRCPTCQTNTCYVCMAPIADKCDCLRMCDSAGTCKCPICPDCKPGHPCKDCEFGCPACSRFRLIYHP